MQKSDFLISNMYFAEDETFAQRLQHEIQAYDNFKRQKETKEKENLNPVDSKLEYIDPTPNIQDLFVTFDKKFFWNTLGMVMVAWSTRMTTCAGLCSFEGRNGLCKISLSAPLLTLRPRKDLVETLLGMETNKTSVKALNNQQNEFILKSYCKDGVKLHVITQKFLDLVKETELQKENSYSKMHEMIHAYLFITNNYKDRDDHGPEFHKHMYRINKEAGTNITVYHTYYDEVEYYQKHIWRCDGPCRFKKPYFGFVRRAANRAPGPNDRWWSQHQKECGGIFVKIQEPEKKPRTKKEKNPQSKSKIKDIREFFKPTDSQKTSNIRTLSDIKAGNTVGMKTNSGTGTLVVTNKNSSKRNKISSDSQKQDSVSSKNKKIKVSDSGMKSTNPVQLEGFKRNSDNARETVRNVWANKFSSSKPVDKQNSSPKNADCDVEILEEVKSIKKQDSQNGNNNKVESASVGDEISRTAFGDTVKQCPVCSCKILQSKMDDHIENCLQCSFGNSKDDEENTQVKCEALPCPCCYKWFRESEMNDHLDECLTLNSLKEEILV